MQLDDLWVIIAAYNEADAIGPVVAGLRNAGARVVVVDDGSLDQTARVALRSGAIVLPHPVNLGQGAALATGIQFALESGARYLATFDADGQHRAEDLVCLYALLREGRADVVIGSRFLGSGADMPAARRLLLRGAVAFTRLTTGLRLTDAHNGLRVMTAGAAAQIRITQNGMAHASEILEEIARRRLRVLEAPITVLYTQYSLAKGQRSLNAVNILLDLLTGRLQR